MQSSLPTPDIIISSSKNDKQSFTENFSNSAIRKRHSLTPKQTTPHRPTHSQKTSVRRTLDTSAMKNGTIEEPILIESKEATPQQELLTSQKKKHIKIYTIEDSPENKKDVSKAKDQREDKDIQCDLFGQISEKKNTNAIEEENINNKENIDNIIVKKNLSKNVECLDMQGETFQQEKITSFLENTSKINQGTSIFNAQNSFLSKIIPEDEPIHNLETTTISQTNETGLIKQDERIKTPLVIPKITNEANKDNFFVKVSVSKEFPNQCSTFENQETLQEYLPKSQENSKEFPLERQKSMGKSVNIMENYLVPEPVQYDSNLLYGIRPPTSPCNPSTSPIKPSRQHNFTASKDASRFGDSPASRRESVGDRSGSKLSLSYDKHGVRNLEENPVFPVEMSFNEDNEDLFESERKEIVLTRNELSEKNQTILDSEVKKNFHLESENIRDEQGKMSSNNNSQDSVNEPKIQEQTKKSIAKSMRRDEFTELGRQSISKINDNNIQSNNEEEREEHSQIRQITMFTPSKQGKVGEETKVTIYFNPFENRRSSVNKDSLISGQSNRVSLDKLENPFMASKEKHSMIIEHENAYHSKFDANEEMDNDQPTFGTSTPWELGHDNKLPLNENTFLMNAERTMLVKRSESKSHRESNGESAMQIEALDDNNENKITTEANPMSLRHAKSPNYLERKLQKIQEENIKYTETNDFTPFIDKKSADKQKPQLDKLINENFNRMQACNNFMDEMKPKKSPKAETTVIKPKEGSYSAIHGVFARSPSKRPNYALPSLSVCTSPIRYDDQKDGKKTAEPISSRNFGTPTHINSSNKRKWDAFQASNVGEHEKTFHEEKKFKHNGLGQTNFDKIVIGNLKKGHDQAKGKLLERKKSSGNKGEMLVEPNILMSKENIPFDSNRQMVSQKKDKEKNCPNVMKTSGTKISKCCAFCGVALEKGQTKLLSCLHRAHIECFTAWERKKKSSCPICNSNSSPISISNFTVSGTKITPGSKF